MQYCWSDSHAEQLAEDPPGRFAPPLGPPLPMRPLLAPICSRRALALSTGLTGLPPAVLAAVKNVDPPSAAGGAATPAA